MSDIASSILKFARKWLEKNAAEDAPEDGYEITGAFMVFSYRNSLGEPMVSLLWSDDEPVTREGLKAMFNHITRPHGG